MFKGIFNIKKHLKRSKERPSRAIKEPVGTQNSSYQVKEPEDPYTPCLPPLKNYLEALELLARTNNRVKDIQDRIRNGKYLLHQAQQLKQKDEVFYLTEKIRSREKELIRMEEYRRCLLQKMKEFPVQ